MTTPPYMTDPPLPPRVAWFAPWTWRPWKRWLMLGLVVVAYVEFPVPIAAVQRRQNRLPIPPLAMSVLETVWAPLNWAYLNNSYAEWFYDIQFDALNAVIDTVMGSE